MSERRSSRYKGVGPSQERILESYLNAFPGVDIDALTANLALATLSTFLREGFEAKMRAMGYDLSRPRYTVVRTLYLSPGRTLPKAEIAEAMRVSGAYVTQLLVSLEADGWVERVRDRADSRVTHVCLTEAGTTHCADLVPQMLKHMVETCGVLSKDELDLLLSMISRIAERAEASASTSPQVMEASS